MATFQLHHLRGGPRCNDGSLPGFYIREGSDVFLVWLEGGGHCGTKEECDQRFAEDYRMSSSKLEAVRELDGIFSDSKLNPAFAHSTRVFIPYCSSDSWLGDRDEPVFGYYFQGRRIISAVMRQLAETFGLNSARLLVFGGCSAGGRGAFYNLDSVCSSLPNASTVCRGLLDAAWWVPDGGVLDASAKNGWQLWGEENPCTATAPDPWRCLYGPTWAPHVRTPFLVHEEQFDHFLLGRLGISSPAFSWSFADWQEALRLRTALRQSLSAAPSESSVVFSGACRGHCLAESHGFWSVEVNSMSMERLTRQWLAGNESSVLETCMKPNCSKGCPFEPLLHELVLALATCLVLALGVCLVFWRAGRAKVASCRWAVFRGHPTGPK
ncbi:unnamed protein product [Effrenium voratum]|nr:unnamed protein product [Effrenium voratum]CAJ1439448.1 unnamed protein product [Effrenium voratum]